MDLLEQFKKPSNQSESDFWAGYVQYPLAVFNASHI